MKYIVQDRETGTFIDEFDTLDEAELAVSNFEVADMECGYYVPNFYEVVVKPNINVAHYNDFIHRSYADGSEKRFMCWFNSSKDELLNVPEVSLCDELFIAGEPDYDAKRHEIDLLTVGESCVVEEDVHIITRVK